MHLASHSFSQVFFPFILLCSFTSLVSFPPISILNVLSKILERAAHSQLSEYLEKRGLLFENQSGFRGGYSTDSCLIGLTDFIKGEIGKGNMVGMVLIDLQKAFDTVDHNVLREKLRSIGVSSTAWFESYLSDRRQCVDVCGSRSEFLPISCGVPQGSILSRLHQRHEYQSYM